MVEKDSYLHRQKSGKAEAQNLVLRVADLQKTVTSLLGSFAMPLNG